jgi:hypothetical protein
MVTAAYVETLENSQLLTRPIRKDAVTQETLIVSAFNTLFPAMNNIEYEKNCIPSNADREIILTSLFHT